jgi:hypothetical protein
MFAALLDCKDIEITTHIWAMRHAIRNNPNALNIRTSITTLKNLLTRMDKDQVENAMVLATTSTSPEAEQSNIMAMPAIAQMQTQLNKLANSIQQVQLLSALYTPGPRQPSRPHSTSAKPPQPSRPHSTSAKPPRTNPYFYYVPPASGQDTQPRTWTDPHTSQAKTFSWCQHCQLWTALCQKGRPL